jgi:hypothetical protein
VGEFLVLVPLAPPSASLVSLFLFFHQIFGNEKKCDGSIEFLNKNQKNIKILSVCSGLV